jgi:hypothetical protein
MIRYFLKEEQMRVLTAAVKLALEARQAWRDAPLGASERPEAAFRDAQTGVLLAACRLLELKF